MKAVVSVATTAPPIEKGSRHSKLTGDFGEALILYWMSKHGFECALVDHTGIDIIARDRRSRKSVLMGISVKTRSRLPGTEREGLNIRTADFEKAERACDAFGCEPHFAFVIDAADTISAFIMSSTHLRRLYPSRNGGTKVVAVQFTRRALDRYFADPDVVSFELKSRTTRWWP